MPPRKLSKSPNEFFRRLRAERSKNQHPPMPESGDIDDFVQKFMWADKSRNGSNEKFYRADKSRIGSKINLN